MENAEKIRLLTEKLNQLEQNFKIEIRALRSEIEILKLEVNSEVEKTKEPRQKKIDDLLNDLLEDKKTVEKEPVFENIPVEDKGFVQKEKEPVFNFQKKAKPTSNQKVNEDFNLEDYIGGNLISKIGVVVLIIGIGIFIKYAIDKNLINPLGRVIIAYAVGGVLLGLSYWLREKYKTYSAVLFGGGTATIYFTTYLGHLFFDIPPQLPAFILMVLITIYTVWEATRYDEEIIGIIGLVGAYAVPILLSKGGGKVEILFTYIIIINIGVMVLAFRKAWDRMSIVAFLNTWLVFIAWYGDAYEVNLHFNSAILFLIASFVIFYISLVAHHIKAREEFSEIKLILVGLNTLLFYGFMWAILANFKEIDAFKAYSQTVINRLVIFNLLHAIFQASIAFYLFREKLQNKALFSLVSGLAIASFTVAIPLYFDEHWVTLLWLIEGFLLFALARYKSVKLVSIEYKSYVILILTLFSLFYIWQDNYVVNANDLGQKQQLFWNVTFLVSWIVVFGVAGLVYISLNYKNQGKEKLENHIVKYTLLSDLQNHISTYLGVLLILLAYFSIFLEINYYFTFDYISTNNQSLIYFKVIWLLSYSGFYLSILALVSNFIIKIRFLQNFALVGSLVFMLLFIGLGFSNLHDLISLYLDKSSNFQTNTFYLNIRYLAYFSAIVFVGSFFMMITQQKRYKEEQIKIYQAVLNIFILAILSFELSNWFVLHSSGTKEAIFEARIFSAKMPFTLLWGGYAFALITFGIWKKRRYLRFTGFGILAITLAKLFLRDINYKSNLSMILAFIGLGILLLIIAFLYQKYKDIILSEDE